MENQRIARMFEEIAELMEIMGENTFKIRAYQRAAREIENLSEPLAVLHAQGRLQEVEGIGKAIADKIVEALEKGEIRFHTELKASLPDGILSLLAVPAMGPKKVKLVYEELGIATIEELKKAAENKRLRNLPGMGAKTEEKILKGIVNLEQSTGRFHLGKAQPIAEEILGRIRNLKSVKRAEYAGSLRRGRETVADIDLLAAADGSAEVMEEFLATPGMVDVLAKGETKCSIQLENGLQVDLRVVPEESFGAALQYFTGSKEHSVQLRELAVKKGIKINEYGVFSAKTNKRLGGEKEEDVYQALGLHFIVPELREGFDEITLAQENRLPKLIERKDIRCAIHNHTDASDGRMTLEELVRQAQNRGYKYIAVTDHSVALGIANGLSPDRLLRQIEEIRELNDKLKSFTVLAGNEVDVLSNGSLAYDDDLLEQLDIVIASLHLGHEQPRQKLMERIRRTCEHPLVDIMAHPTGRLIQRRPPMDLDMEALFSMAAETGTALEINSNYYRLDLKDKHIREAKNHGVIFTIDTDTHTTQDFDLLDYGIKTARRGRLEAKDVLNTLPLDKFLKRIKRNRR